MQKHLYLWIALIYWLWLPLEANAWGLYAHVAYTQHWLAALPLLPSVRTLPKGMLRVIQHYPQLVMAGACLPDLAVVSRQIKHSHGWGIGQQLLQTKDDQALALGIGYHLHLLADVVAHQHFVPSFEASWQRASVLTHAMAEWAMDAHLQHPDCPMPATLLNKHRAGIVNTLAARLNLSASVIDQAVTRLALADSALRWSRIPQGLYWRYQRQDHEFKTKLDYYQHQVSVALQALPSVLSGEFPSLHAEEIHLSVAQLEAWRSKCLQDARLRPTTAIRLFEQYHHQWCLPPDC